MIYLESLPKLRRWHLLPRCFGESGHRGNGSWTACCDYKPCAAEALPEELRDVLYCKTAQPREIANCLEKIMTISAGEYQRMGDVLAETARADHCDIQLFDRIVSRIKSDLS